MFSSDVIVASAVYLPKREYITILKFFSRDSKH